MRAEYAKNKKRTKTGLVAAGVLLVCMLLLAWGLHHSVDTPSSGSSSAADMVESDPAASVAQSGAEEQKGHSLGMGLTLLDVDKYSGIYMEDGTDEIVTNVLMLIVRNDGDRAIQYAELTIPTSGGEARFSLSTLPVGESIVLLEQSRMLWSAGEDYSNVSAGNVAVFSEPLTLCEDQLKFQTLNGVINVTNISGEEITGDIVIYYKNAAVDLLYGGITYRIRLEGGLKVDEIRQIMASHFAQSGSRIMFVTIG